MWVVWATVIGAGLGLYGWAMYRIGFEVGRTERD